MPSAGFQFKQFYVAHHACAHKVGTDGVLIAAWTEVENTSTILDIGSGSGLISLICAQRFPQAHVVGIEQDAAAFAQACENVQNSPFTARIKLEHGDFGSFRFRGMYDCIISNPPFFDGATSSGNTQRDKARATVGLSHQLLAQKSVELLHPSGTFSLILPKAEAKQFIRLAEKSGLFLQRRCKVYGTAKAEDKRWMMSFGHQSPATVSEESLILRKEDSSYTDAYKTLCAAFYL